QQAERQASAAGDHVAAGWRAFQAGRIHRLREQADAVLACAERAEASWQSAEADDGAQSNAWTLRGYGHFLKGAYQDAIAAHRTALDLRRRCLPPESAGVARALNDVAIAERAAGDVSAAEREYSEALRIARAIGFTEGAASCTGNLAP